MQRDQSIEPAKRGSRMLHAIDRMASRPMLAIIMVSIGVVWVLGSIAFGFPSRVETAFQTVVAAVTLAMVFVIQHTQARQQVATQRKLDEILNALPHADNSLIAFEDAPDREIVAQHQTHRRLRRDAVEARTLG